MAEENKNMTDGEGMTLGKYVLERFIESIEGINLNNKPEDRDNNLAAFGAMTALKDVLDCMGYLVQTSLFIDENDVRMIPYYIFEGKKYNMILSEQYDRPPVEDLNSEQIGENENQEKVEQDEKPVRKVDRHGKIKDKKSAYLTLYSELFPDRQINKKSKYDKVMRELMAELFTPAERRYLTLRYGLDGNGKRFFHEIANQEGNISRDKVRTVINRMLDTLREQVNNETVQELFENSEIEEPAKETEKVKEIEVEEDIEETEDDEGFEEPEFQSEPIEQNIHEVPHLTVLEENKSEIDMDGEEDNDPDFLDDFDEEDDESLTGEINLDLDDNDDLPF